MHAMRFFRTAMEFGTSTQRPPREKEGGGEVGNSSTLSQIPVSSRATSRRQIVDAQSAARSDRTFFRF